MASADPPDPAVLQQADLAQITRLSAVDAVRGRILLALRLGLLRPDQRLAPAPTLAEGLDVSAITARRALESLVDDGVLVRRRGRGGGTFVATSPTEPDEPAVAALEADRQLVNRLIDRRVLMESAIVAAAVPRITPADLAELDRLVAINDTTDEWEDFHYADQGIHHVVARASGLPEIDAYLETLQALVGYFLPYPVEQLHGAVSDHHDLVRAMHLRDVPLAVEITVRHVRRLRDDMYIGLPRER